MAIARLVHTPPFLLLASCYRAGIQDMCGSGGRQGRQEVGRGSCLSLASCQPCTGTSMQPAGRVPIARECVEPAHHLGIGACCGSSPALPGPCLSVAPGAKVSLQFGSMHPLLCDCTRATPACLQGAGKGRSPWNRPLLGSALDSALQDCSLCF